MVDGGRGMSALRKAGVWLGLVEEDDRGEDGVFDDEFGDDDDFEQPARPRTLARQRSTDRGDMRAAERDRRLSDDELGLSAGLSERAASRASERLPRTWERPEPRVTEREPQPRLTERDSRLLEREDRRTERALDRDPTSDRADLAGGDLHLDDRASDPPRPERASVRQLTRPSPVSTSTQTSTSVNLSTHENLALAPQVQLRERAIVSEDTNRRHQITTLHPTMYSDARAIGEQFRDGHPVIINLTELDEPDAKRLVDFAAGLAFGLRGSMERVTNRVFLLSPPNIQVSAEDKARIAEGGFFDQA
jgi:cell division inhibitor SepF